MGYFVRYLVLPPWEVGTIKDYFLVHGKAEKVSVEAFASRGRCGDLPGPGVFCGVVDSKEKLGVGWVLLENT